MGEVTHEEVMDGGSVIDHEDKDGGSYRWRSVD